MFSPRRSEKQNKTSNCGTKVRQVPLAELKSAALVGTLLRLCEVENSGPATLLSKQTWVDSYTRAGASPLGNHRSFHLTNLSAINCVRRIVR